MAIGLAAILLITGLIEAFVTPCRCRPRSGSASASSPSSAFFVYVWTLGRRAVPPGEYGDIDESDREATAPVSA